MRASVLVVVATLGLVGCGALPAQAAEVSVERPEVGRTFAEPLIAMGTPAPGETRELAAAIRAYRAAADAEAVQPILAFLDAHPGSAWKPSLLANLAILYRHTGYLDRALAAAREAWGATELATDPAVKRVADTALATEVELISSLGRTAELAALLDRVATRPLAGHASATVSGARLSLWQMRHAASGTFRCGPLAIERVGEALHPGAGPDPRVQQYPSTGEGTSLAELARLAHATGLDLHAVKREAGSAIPVPAVVHWKADHFAALVAQQGDRFLIKDPTFGDNLWLSRAAIEEEASGYLLAAGAGLEKGWRSVPEAEAAGVRGKGVAANPNPGATAPGDPKKPTPCGGAKGSGMPGYNFHIAPISLNITDSPVGYQPPRGPAMGFGITYNSDEDFQPATFTFTNLGSRWSFDWLSYVEDDNAGTIRVAELGGGSYLLPQQAPPNGSNYGPNVRGQHETVMRLLQSSGTVGFLRQYPDGSQALYQQSDHAATMTKYFLTSMTDPTGTTVTFTYDTATTRLLAIVDPLGQQTTLSYGLSGDIYKLTAVTDPFGRQATFQYTNGELASVTDAAGMTSSFAYGPSATDSTLASDFMNALTTPYGTTSFDTGFADPPSNNDIGLTLWLVATDPLGYQERVEFIHQAPGVLAVETDPVPAGVDNQLLEYRDTYYWNQTAMQQYSAADPNRYLNATYTYHWLRDATESVTAVASIPETIQAQGERRVWYTYPNQPALGYQGTLSTATATAWVLDDGQTQTDSFTYDPSGRPQTHIDAVGRSYTFRYTNNGIDLASVTNPSLEQLAGYTYNSIHEPLTYTDYAGQTWTLTYNSFGQPTSLRRPDGGTVNLTYSAQGFLTGLAVAGTSYQESYTYDAANRLHTWTSTDGRTLTFGYDNLDRLILITYPDATTEQVVYDKLDVVAALDRMGRVTTYAYDAADRLSTLTDPAGRTTSYSWCGCGALAQVADPRGNLTTWMLDALDRVVGKQVNGQVTVLYTYDTAGRLVRRTDALQQQTLYSYTVDDMLAAIAYAANVPTPGVQFAYDAFYPRLTAMLDGLGSTLYTYVPALALGAGQVATITAPAPQHTITFQYDTVGRQVGRTLDGIAQTVSFDSLNRPSSLTNQLGTFTAGYDGASGRLTSFSYPNGQGAAFSYLDAAHDFRLSQLTWGSTASGFNLSQFNYTYDAAHDQILGLTWHDINNPTGRFWNFAYDGAKQLVARQQTTDPTQSPVTTLHTNAYAYDAAGNRTSETIDTALSAATYDGANQLIAIETGLSAHAAIELLRSRRPPGRPLGGPGAAGSVNGGSHEN